MRDRNAQQFHKSSVLSGSQAVSSKAKPREIPLAARSHRFFGNTLVKAGHLMRPSAQRKVPGGHEDEERLTAAR